MTPAETLAKSKQLDRFLGRSVGQLKQADQASMNRFAELAAKIRANREAMEEEAVKLDVEAEETMSMFMGAVTDNRSMLSDAREGAKAMREAALGMAGHNSGPLPDSSSVSPPSPPVVDSPMEVRPYDPVEAAMPLQPAPAPVVEPTPLPVLDPTATGNPPA